jgi:hypothetical protein
MNEKRELLRHTLATIAYRTTRAVSDAPEEFGSFDGAGREPVKILAHMGDLFDWALTLAQGQSHWHTSVPLPWAEERQRFFASLAAFDAYLNSGAPIQAEIERLMQGPVADALTHIGQLAMLRRMAGSPTMRENFTVAPIVLGRVGAEQAMPEKKSKS